MGAMELEEKTVRIRDDFDPDKILESGQCFRPRKQAEGWYRWQVLLRAPKVSSIVRAWRWIASARPAPTGLRIALDVDAYSLM